MTFTHPARDVPKMSERELLQLVLCFPEYLTDGYYSDTRQAIWRRVEQLGIFPRRN